MQYIARKPRSRLELNIAIGAHHDFDVGPLYSASVIY